MKYVQGIRYRWKLPEAQLEQGAVSLACDLNISQQVAHLLMQRGCESSAKARDFLFPLYDAHKYHASHLHDAEKAVDRLCHAIESKERILVAGDYDVDGMTSTALVVSALIDCGADVNFHLPNRITEGYGLSRKIVERAARNGYRLIVTVDNGIAAYDAARASQEYGIDLIITDHHRPQAPLPEGLVAVVNPQQEHCGYAFKELAGVGVAFKVVQLLYERLNKQIAPKIYELLLLGTIADVVPLKEENRYWVLHGLRIVEETKSLALSILQENARLALSEPLSATDIAFMVTPQLNALGRLEDPRQAVLFLLETDEKEVCDIGRYLFQLNQKRKEVETSIFQQICARIGAGETYGDAKTCVIVSGNWPVGLVGLVAARVSQQYGVPACVLHETASGLLKGSCRSIPECDIFACLKALPKGILETFGGHAHAAAVSLKQENLERFATAFAAEIERSCAREDLQPKIFLDSYVDDVSEVNEKLWEDLQLLEPYGAGNPFPLFYIPHVYVAQAPTLVKDAHVKVQLQGSQARKSVIFFNRPDLYTFFNTHVGPFAVAAKLTRNVWRQKSSIELIGVDVAIG